MLSLFFDFLTMYYLMSFNLGYYILYIYLAKA